MIAAPTIQAIMALVIGLFLIQVAKRLTAQSTNPVAVALNDGLTFITS